MAEHRARPRRPAGPDAAGKPDNRYRTIAVNRRARFNYDILEQLEAGLVLTGAEIKSVREGRVDISEAYARVRDGEVWLLNAHIAEYAGASHYSEHDPRRPKKLLLHKRQIARLELEVGQQRLTMVPLRLYLKDHHAKVELALGRGRRRHDRRRAIAAREQDREMRRATGMRRE
ncbi:MAG: SsrA-binding protein SmpB [Dehalococcoidia bacterium]